MIKYLLTLLIIFSFNTYAKDQCEFLDNLSPYQRSVAYQAYRAGQPFDLELTTVAIAWQESKLGIYKIRYRHNELSVGVAHTLVKYKTKGMTNFERDIWVQEMIQDDARSINIMIQDLLYWKNIFNGSWKKMVQGYNAGFGKNQQYINDITNTVKHLKQCEF